MRAEKGKGLGEESASLLKELATELGELQLMAFGTGEEPETKGSEDLESANAELRAAYLRFIRDNT